MEQERGTFVLRLGRESLRLVDLDRVYDMRSGWDEKRHSNAQWELHFVLEGSCRVDLEDRSLALHAGQALLIRPGQYHRPRALPGAFGRLSLAFFGEKGTLAEQLVGCCPGTLLLEPDASQLRLARELLQEFGTNRPFRQACLEGMLTQFLVGILRRVGICEEGSTGNATDTRQITSLIDAYFEAHFSDAAGEAELAARLHMSRRQLLRIMQEHYGMSFREKLIHTRMDYAAWLLRTSGQRVSDICQTVGYSSEAAFFKTFRKHFGMTPNRYRADKRE